MAPLIIKKSTLAKSLSLLFAISYGFFIASYLKNLYILDSGDIRSLVSNFEKFENLDGLVNHYKFNLKIYLSGDFIFRFFVLYLQSILNQSSLAVLGIIAFITSSITFFSFSVNIRLNKNLILILFLFLMVFTTPRVINLFASGVRSGIAFVLLVIAIMYLKGTKQYVLSLLSTLIHASMAPIIFFYLLFCWLENKRTKLSFGVYLFLLSICSCLIALVTPQLGLAY